MTLVLFQMNKYLHKMEQLLIKGCRIWVSFETTYTTKSLCLYALGVTSHIRPNQHIRAGHYKGLESIQDFKYISVMWDYIHPQKLMTYAHGSRDNLVYKTQPILIINRYGISDFQPLSDSKWYEITFTSKCLISKWEIKVVSRMRLNQH